MSYNNDYVSYLPRANTCSINVLRFAVNNNLVNTQLSPPPPVRFGIFFPMDILIDHQPSLFLLTFLSDLGSPFLSTTLGRLPVESLSLRLA